MISTRYCLSSFTALFSVYFPLAMRRATASALCAASTRSSTRSVGVLVGLRPPGSPLCAGEQHTQIVPTFDLAQALRLNEFVEGFSVRRTPSEHPCSRLPGRIVHDSHERRLCHSRATRLFVGFVRISKHLLSLSPEGFYFLVCYGVVKVPPLLQYAVFIAPVKRGVEGVWPCTLLLPS